MKVFYYTFGCKVNQYETENVRERFEKRGYSAAESISDADICVVNTCTVTAQSDSKCMQLIRRIRKENPHCILAVAGCMTQAFPDEAAKLIECDVIAGSQNKTHIPDMVEKFINSGERIIEIEPHKQHEEIEEMFNSSVETKTRAYIKIQDGCDMNCSYCIIPKARGHIRSKPLDVIAEETAALIKSGHKEIILTGINLCCYGRELQNGTRLIDAIETVCSADGDFRVRLGSIEPEMLSDEDIQRMSRQQKLCPQFHLSLQSGCDKTLKNMNRKYDAAEYALLCRKLREAFPNCAITTDIMVGFAGETQQDHEQSVNFAREIAFADAHIFPYSRRAGTAADKMEQQVDNGTKHKRAAEMSEVCALSRREYLAVQVGKVKRVLFEKESSPYSHQGHTAEYIVVKVPRTSDLSLRRQFKNVEITAYSDKFCIGRIVD